MQDNDINMSQVLKQPRGACLVANTSVGNIQVFIPVEVLKDAYVPNQGFPDYYIVSDDFLSENTDFFNFGGFEFPAYTKFITGSKVNVVCEKFQVEIIEENINISIQAEPDKIKLDLESMYLPEDKDLVPDLLAESMDLSGKHTVDELLNIICFEKGKITLQKKDHDGSVTGEVEVFKLAPNKIEIYDRVQEKWHGPFTLNYKAPSKLAKERFSPYYIKKNLQHGFPYVNTLAYIASASGLDLYDKKQNPSHRYGDTTGACYIDKNGRIVIVDPPINTPYLLLDSKVNFHNIDAIVITHCHEDHDGGLVSTYLSLPNNVPVYITPANRQKEIIKILNNLSSGISDHSLFFTSEDVESIFNFQDIHMRHPIQLTGDFSFEFFHSWHSVEAVGYYLYNKQGQRLEYWSGDTQLLLDKVNQAADKGVMTQRRADQLINLKPSLHYSIEMGLPEYLHNSLDAVFQLIERNNINPATITVTHTAKDQGIKEMNLAKTGALIDLNTGRLIDIEKYKFTGKINIYNEIISIAAMSKIFKNNPSKQEEFASCCSIDSFESGELIYQTGDPADYTYFYLDGGYGHIVLDRPMGLSEKEKIIDSMNSRERYPDLVAHRYQRGTILGEGCFINKKVRTKFVYAVGKPRYLKVPYNAWQILMDEKEFTAFKNKMILSLAIRQMKLPGRIAVSTPFAGVDLPIIEELITSKAGFFSFKFGDYLIRQGKPLEYIYFITRGSFKVTKQPKLIEKFIEKEIIIAEQYVFSDESACLVGEMSLLDNAGLPKSNIVITSETADVIAFSREAVLELAQNNPRLSLNLRLMSMKRKIQNYEKLKNAEKTQSSSGHMLSLEDEILKIKYDPLTLSMSDYTEIINWLPSGLDKTKK